MRGVEFQEKFTDCRRMFLDLKRPFHQFYFGKRHAVYSAVMPHEAEFVIGDPTEIPNPHAKKTDYVGVLSDGETRGYWALLLITPFHSRAISCQFVSYSSKLIDQEATSRNRCHFQAFSKLKDLLGDRPLVLDREFSYLELGESGD